MIQQQKINRNKGAHNLMAWIELKISFLRVRILYHCNKITSSAKLHCCGIQRLTLMYMQIFQTHGYLSLPSKNLTFIAFSLHKKVIPRLFLAEFLVASRQADNWCWLPCIFFFMPRRIFPSIQNDCPSSSFVTSPYLGRFLRPVQQLTVCLESTG